MGQAVVDYLVDFVHGLDDAPAEATEGGIELARTLRGGPPELGGDFDELFEQMKDAAARTFEYAGPGYLAYIPGGGLYTAALAEFMAQGVNRYINLWQPSPGHGPDRAERRPLALRPVRLPRRRARPPHVRRLHGELLRDRHGAPRQARRGLPRRHLLRQRAGPRQRVEGREPRRLLPAEPAAGPDRPPAADGRGGAPRHGRRPTARPASVRSWWCRRRGRPTPARSTRSTTSPTSRPRPACGCTSTRPTAASSS